MAEPAEVERKAALAVWCPRCYVNPGVQCKGDGKSVVHVLRIHNWRKSAA